MSFFKPERVDLPFPLSNREVILGFILWMGASFTIIQVLTDTPMAITIVIGMVSFAVAMLVVWLEFLFSE